MYWTARDANLSRPATNQLILMAEDGNLDWEQLARDLLGWMDESDVNQFALANDLIPDPLDSDEDDTEDDTDEDQDSIAE